MAELVVLGYDDDTTARAVYQTVVELQKDYIIDGSAATLKRDKEGKVIVETPTGAVGAGTASGALWGGLMGAALGKAADMGIDDQFREKVQGVLQPGHSAVVLLFNKVTPDKALAALAPYGGQVLRTSLSEEAEAELTKALSRAG